MSRVAHLLNSYGRYCRFKYSTSEIGTAVLEYAGERVVRYD